MSTLISAIKMLAGKDALECGWFLQTCDQNVIEENFKERRGHNPNKKEWEQIKGVPITEKDLKRGTTVFQKDNPEYGLWFLVRENPPGTWEVHKEKRPSDGIAVAKSELFRFWEKLS